MAGAAPDALNSPASMAFFKVSLAGLLAYANDRISAAKNFPRSGLVRRSFRVGRLDMTVWFTSERLAELCDASLVQNSGEPPRTAAEIFVLDASASGWEMPARWDEVAGFSSREFERILAQGGRRGFYHHDAPSWQFYDPAARVGVHTLPAPMEIPPWELGSPLRLFIHWALAAAGYRLTHAATLGVGGRGALIVGASGSGKSGTTLAGLLNGLQSAGDDYVVVEQGADVVARSVFRLFKQDLNGLRRAGVDPENLPDVRQNWHGKIEFDAARLAPKAFVDRLKVGALLLPHIAHAQCTRIEPATAREAALALAPSAVLQLPGDAAEGFQFFMGLAKRLPAFHVSLSENPVEIADTIGSFLEREAGHSG